MDKASYDAIAEWYNELVNQENTVMDFVASALMRMVGEVHNQQVCDLACGQGKLARHLVQQGAQVTAIDLSADLIAIAQREAPHPSLRYVVDNAETLDSIEDEQFELVVCNLALMDIPDLSQTVKTVWRVLRSAGRFVFSITHPCFEAPHAEWLTAADGKISREISSYFQEGFWKSTYAEGVRGKVGAHHRMLSTYINTLVQAGLTLDKILEPQAVTESPEALSRFQVIPAFMIIQCHKP